jgi:hypothetical protein
VDWLPTKRQVLWAVGIVIVLLILGSIGVWLWGVLAGYIQPKTPTDKKDLVNVFVVIAAGVIGLLTATAAVGNLYISRRNLQQQRDLDERRAQEDALQSYFEQMGDLLTNHSLINTDREDIRQLAQGQTLTVLARLDDRRRQGALVRFLHGAGLINRGTAIISLMDAILVGVDLYYTVLEEADLSGADLRDALVTEEQLAACASLEGATMPNGQKYEEWLKDKEGRRGEWRKNSGP